MAFVPSWRKKQILSEAQAPVQRKPRFPGDAFGGPDVLENTGKIFSPRSPGAQPARTILRAGPGLEPDSHPPMEPTHDLRKLQPKMRNKVLRAMRKTRKVLKKKLKQKGKSKKQIRKIGFQPRNTPFSK